MRADRALGVGAQLYPHAAQAAAGVVGLVDEVAEVELGGEIGRAHV